MKRKLFLKSVIGLFAAPLVFKEYKPYWGSNRERIKIYNGDIKLIVVDEAIHLPSPIEDMHFLDAKQYSLSARIMEIQYKERMKNYNEFMDSFMDNYYNAAQIPRKL